MSRPPVGVVVDPRQPGVGLQHTLGDLVRLVAKYAEDAKVANNKSGKGLVAGMATEARAPEIGELVARTPCLIAAALAARSGCCWESRLQKLKIVDSYEACVGLK